MRPYCFILISFLTFCLTACSSSNFPFLYQPDIQQGNLLPEERLAALKIGMNQDEVNYLLGNPILTDALNPEETQYVYTFKEGKKPMQKKTLLLTFSHDRLVNSDSLK